MPSFVRSALVRHGLLDAYRARPPYQRNDNLGWILRAKLEPTRQRRLAQMLDELSRGDRYMKMAYRPKRLPVKRTGRTDAAPDGDISLIAPCGMLCSRCSGYLARLNDVPRKRGRITHCAGCRARDKQCAYLKGACSRLRRGRVTYCSECPDFPCLRLTKIDTRYRMNYGYSFIRSLEEVRDRGAERFLQDQRRRFTCPRCNGWLSIHNGKCFACDAVAHWRA